MEIGDRLHQLVGEISDDRLNALAASLHAAAASPLRNRWVALQRVSAKIRKQLQHLADVRDALAEAARALGIDPSQLGKGGLTAMMEELRRCRSQLCERREKALQILEESLHPSQHAEDDPASVKMLIAEVEGLEARVLALQSNAMRAASHARTLWEELGELSEPRRDDHAARLSADGQDDHIATTITRSVADAVETSQRAWLDRHGCAEAERLRLHRALHAFGLPEDINEFLATHCALHCHDLAACRDKFDEVMAAVRAEERRPKHTLRQLYEESGLGSAAFRLFEDSLESAESRVARQRMLARETERFQESLSNPGAAS